MYLTLIETVLSSAFVSAIVEFADAIESFLCKFFQLRLVRERIVGAISVMNPLWFDFQSGSNVFTKRFGLFKSVCIRTCHSPVLLNFFQFCLAFSCSACWIQGVHCSPDVSGGASTFGIGKTCCMQAERKNLPSKMKHPKGPVSYYFF